MNRENKYSAFTLVEMLIVMGIIIVLMGVGITAGRFAINRANDVAHQNAVDQAYQALQAYYTDNREYPFGADCNAGGDATDCTFSTLIGAAGSTTGALSEYMDAGSFDGGSDASYYYLVEESLGQSVLVCVSLGGPGDEKGRGVYCNGNGFNNDTDMGVAVTDNNIDPSEDATEYAAFGTATSVATTVDGASDWADGAWGSVTGWIGGGE